ncbi:MAG: Cof-type HAD-IIB family hydrolase [Anaerolineales bacterium]|nr:Cof-type HAD-IIB family hydrolase [Anaerolineales bacterium]
MSYKLIAADLDGTLRVDQQSFTPRLRDAVRRAQARDVRVVIATGRMYRTAAPFARELGMTSAIICDHGATIRDARSGKILFQKTVPLDLAREVIERASDDLAVLVCVAEEFYAPRLTANIEKFVSAYRDYLHVVPDLARALPGEPQKILFINDESVTDSLFVELKIRFGKELQVVQSYPTYVELTHRDVSKGNAVTWLARRWNIAREEVIALGDHDNDRSMIEWAGLGVAMGNAIERVKAIADFIAPSVDEDGAANVIEKFVLDADE